MVKRPKGEHNMSATLIIPNVSVGFFHEGKWLTANASHPQYTAIEKAVGVGKFSAASKLISLKEAVSIAVTGSKLELLGNELYYQGNVVRGILGRRILEMIKMGHDCRPLELFLENLLQNPSSRAVEELYGFMEVSQLPITDDGHFLAYKSVRQDFTDHHTGKMDNSVGTTVSMQRNLVDEDKDRTCSYGLHFAAHEYAKGFGSGGRMVILKINPKDVVAIPSDYKNMKGRACSYEILEEVARGDSSLVNAQVVVGKKTYVPQADNYDDSNIWQSNLGYLTFKGNHEEFPVNRDVPYTLERTSTSKLYRGDFYFQSYDEKNDNLIFARRGYDGEIERYVTIKDSNEWDIIQDLSAGV
jgi:hypothetical protein